MTILSEGHNSLYNSFRAEEGMRHVQETTPLVRYPTPQRSPWGPWSALALGMLVAMLFMGVVISSYLMYVQVNEDAPLESSMMLISREQWADVVDAPLNVDPSTHPVRHVIVVQTGGPTCDDIAVCAELLNNMQEKNGEALMYNFLVSSNGATFEGLGWDRKSPMFPQLPALVVAFIGNFTNDCPSTSQLEEAFTLFDESNTKGYLTRDFTIIGKIVNSTEVPTYLFDSLQNLTQWDRVLSDDY